MGPQDIVDGLIFYLGLVALLTFHEFAHAWVAHACGDDTARLQGRLSLNPLVHMDPLGTVLLPLFMIFGPTGMGRFLIGYAKPVPITLQNLKNPVRDDILIALAGPAMNLLLGVLLIGMARVAMVFNSEETTNVFLQMAQLSLLLCFFNLIPIPPLDGSHVLRNFIGMSWDMYLRLCRPPFGFIIIIILMNITYVRMALAAVTAHAFYAIGYCFHFPLA